MRNSQEIIFILLLSGLQWTENNAAYDTNPTYAILLTSSTSSPSTHTTERTVTTGITPSVISPTASAERTTPSTTVDKSTQSSSTTPSLTAISLLKTTHQSTLSTKDGSHSSISITSITSTSNSRMSPTSVVSSTVSSDLSTISKSDGTTPSVISLETASVNFTTASYDVNSTTMASTNKTEVAVPPTQILPNVSTTPLIQKNTTTVTNVKISSRTPSPQTSFTDSAESREPQKGHHNNGGVVFGAIVGAVLGCALISLVGYFLCGKRKSDSFGHQRLYDDTRNDPVLRLDNVPEPYGANFGDLSYYNPPTANKTAAHDAIPMEDMTPS
ncbi:hypothetical protein lerEdw1_011220 [Lerista edwardsae]|nr:hypothetical protein lerEdw1_011220 [Lerista edwardsae]